MKRKLMLFGIVMLSLTSPTMAQDGGTRTETTTATTEREDDDDGDKGLWGLLGLAGLLGLLKRKNYDRVHVSHSDTTRR